MYSKKQLKDLTSNLRSLEYICIFEFLLSQYTNPNEMEKFLKNKMDVKIEGLDKGNNIWGSLYNPLYCEFKNLPLLLGKMSDTDKDIILWRLSRGV